MSYSHVVKALVLGMCVVSAKSFWPIGLPITVRIHMYNGMGLDDSPALSLHCKSADDDLGFHELAKFGQEFEWSFVPNIWGTTFFWCNVWWNNKTIKIVYDAQHGDRSFDERCNEPQKYYKFTEQGFYLSYDMHHWSPQPFPWGYIDTAS